MYYRRKRKSTKKIYAGRRLTAFDELDFMIADRYYALNSLMISFTEKINSATNDVVTWMPISDFVKTEIDALVDLASYLSEERSKEWTLTLRRYEATFICLISTYVANTK